MRAISSRPSRCGSTAISSPNRCSRSFLIVSTFDIAPSPLEHDPEKACHGLDPGWYRFSEKIMLQDRLERDDDSEKSHPALGISQIMRRSRADVRSEIEN